jgi:hypothetical protein
MRARPFDSAGDIAVNSVPSGMFLARVGKVAAKIPLSVQQSAQEQEKVRYRTFEAKHGHRSFIAETRRNCPLPYIAVLSTIQQ